MSDGAQQGVSATRALATILGGEPAPGGEEKETREEVEARIRATERGTDYGTTCDYAARLILEYLEEDKARVEIPVENVYEKDRAGALVFTQDGSLNLLESGLYERMKADGRPIDDLDLTGFMWGWAVNTARWILDEPAVPNPAIVTIDCQP